ncbi:nitrate reductase [Methylococcus sp. EFPC2]|uniref:nitrate reductase n=1 Tax=Methylococcus sp. EFPC2 TaxID=2812648 RepID=UPI001968035F|nr:nitrate reductase [Methylococcus sp. EFPC2]QSA97649.1 molybdopterin-dependent oxidoreductase [Methylococcus sp. EFPC2]
MNDNATIKTTCPYCGVGCGVAISREADGRIAVQGDEQHPSNFGRLCSKGSALGDTLGLDGRLLHPEIAGRRANWDEALAHVAEKFRQTIAEHGPDSVAFYVSGQLLTEDYYVANKLMKGFIGSGNIDTNSRLCMSSSVAGHKRAFGEDLVPGCYEDLELADLIVLVGSNTAWCHPILYQRIAAAKQSNAKLKVVSIDPRRTATCDLADLHLPLAPGSDVMLFNGLLNYLRRHDHLDYAYLESHVSGYAAALAEAQRSAADIPAVAAACGLPESDIATFYQWFARTEKTVTAWSQGVNQSSSGTDKVNAIINVHLATGRIGKPGMGPFSLTGQPNAMGGREVGGLANQLAAHMEFDNPAHWYTVAEFWRAPHLARNPGLKAVEMFEAVAEGRIKALWIMATNPAVSLPDANKVRAALAGCEFVVVSDCEDRTDLTPYAHVRLPAAAWGEKDGTVTNSERRISRQRAFLPLPGEARPDWWIVSEVARRMGWAEAFPYREVREIFVEHAALSACGNEGERHFDLRSLAALDAASYDGLPPQQWPLGTSRLFADGRYSHADGKAKMLALSPNAPAHALDADYPLALNTGRIRDQWHTMTRTSRSPKLNRHSPEPYAEIHPTDAASFGLQAGALAKLESRWGTTLARVKISEDQRPGSVFMPMHWGDRNSRQALANALVNPVVDPFSGEPESKHTPVRIAAYRPAWHGFLISRDSLPAIAEAAWCVTVRGDGYSLYELAGEQRPESWSHWLKCLIGGKETTGDAEQWLEFGDPARGRYRAARLHDDRLADCLFVGPDHELPSRDWLCGLFGEATLSPGARASLLAGKPASADDDRGRTVCACFGVGIKTLQQAIRQQGLSTPEQIGTALKAGTNCGSCIPELKSLLREAGV